MDPPSLAGFPGSFTEIYDLMACVLPEHIANCNFDGEILWIPLLLPLSLALY